MDSSVTNDGVITDPDIEAEKLQKNTAKAFIGTIIGGMLLYDAMNPKSQRGRLKRSLKRTLAEEFAEELYPRDEKGKVKAQPQESLQKNARIQARLEVMVTRLVGDNGLDAFFQDQGILTQEARGLKPKFSNETTQTLSTANTENDQIKIASIPAEVSPTSSTTPDSTTEKQETNKTEEVTQAQTSVNQAAHEEISLPPSINQQVVNFFHEDEILQKVLETVPNDVKDEEGLGERDKLTSRLQQRLTTIQADLANPEGTTNPKLRGLRKDYEHHIQSISEKKLRQLKAEEDAEYLFDNLYAPDLIRRQKVHTEQTNLAKKNNTPAPLAIVSIKRKEFITFLTKRLREAHLIIANPKNQSPLDLAINDYQNSEIQKQSRGKKIRVLNLSEKEKTEIAKIRSLFNQRTIKLSKTTQTANLPSVFSQRVNLEYRKNQIKKFYDKIISKYQKLVNNRSFFQRIPFPNFRQGFNRGFQSLSNNQSIGNFVNQVGNRVLDQVFKSGTKRVTNSLTKKAVDAGLKQGAGLAAKALAGEAVAAASPVFAIVAAIVMVILFLIVFLVIINSNSSSVLPHALIDNNSQSSQITGNNPSTASSPSLSDFPTSIIFNITPIFYTSVEQIVKNPPLTGCPADDVVCAKKLHKEPVMVGIGYATSYARASKLYDHETATHHLVQEVIINMKGWSWKDPNIWDKAKKYVEDILVADQSQLTPREALDSGKVIGFSATRSCEDKWRKKLMFGVKSQKNPKPYFIGVVQVIDCAADGDYLDPKRMGIAFKHYSYLGWTNPSLSWLTDLSISAFTKAPVGLDGQQNSMSNGRPGVIFIDSSQAGNYGF